LFGYKSIKLVGKKIMLRNCLNLIANFFIGIFRWILFFLLAGLATKDINQILSTWQKLVTALLSIICCPSM
jgi:hypothetical protein